MAEVWSGPMPEVARGMPEVEMHPELVVTVERELQALHLQPFNEEALRLWSDLLSRAMAEREERLFETLGVRRTRIRARIVPHPENVHRVDLHFFVDGQRVLPIMLGVADHG